MDRSNQTKAEHSLVPYEATWTCAPLPFSSFLVSWLASRPLPVPNHLRVSADGSPHPEWSGVNFVGSVPLSIGIRNDVVVAGDDDDEGWM